jgi:hypothetical protein
MVQTVTFVKGGKERTWEIHGGAWGQDLGRDRVETDGRISAKALDTRLREMFAMVPAIKEIETSYQMNGHGCSYSLKCDTICPNLKEILEKLELMPYKISLDEYNKAENELYEDSPFGKRLKR